MSDRIVKYNPAFLSDAELMNSFVVRLTDLQLIMRIISDNVTGSNQHVLVIGPRGSGKTTLVRRVAIEIESKEELSTRWYPLIFSEESYEVVTVGEFWLEALFHLAEQTGDEKWKKTYEELKNNEPDDQRLAERALAQLLDFADSRGKRILLIVENINMLFNDLISEDAAWKMRHTLINEPRLMLLATATNRFDNIENASQAMFEMFKIHELKPLNDEECNLIWEKIAGKKLIGEQVRAIRILTGGTPRLLVIIAKFSGHRKFGKLLEDLVGLIDDHTEYFKSQLDNLPAIERKVYLALAELWDPSTARDIAKAARLDVNKTSSLLNRLVGRGAVLVEEQRKKTKWYVVAERMYNIYYLMRRRGKPTDRVKAAVKFMVCMYDAETATRMIIEEAGKLPPDRCSDYYLAYPEFIKLVPDQQIRERLITSTPKSFLEAPYINEALKSFLPSDDKKESKDSLSAKEEAELDEMIAVTKQSIRFLEDKRYIEAIEKYDQVIERLGRSAHSAMTSLVAIAMLGKGTALGELNRSEEAIQVFDAVIALYKDRPESALSEVARAMLGKGVALVELHRSEEAIRVYDEIIALYKDRRKPELTEAAALAMLAKGAALGELNRSEEAIQVFDAVIGLYKDRSETQIAQKVAIAMLGKGKALEELKRSEEAIRIYDELIALYKNRPEPKLVKEVARAMFGKGVTLLIELNRAEEAIQAFDEVMALHKDHPESEHGPVAARAMIIKGMILSALEKHADAEKAFHQAIELNPNLTPAYIQLIELLLKGSDKYEEALRIAETIIDKRPDDVDLLNKMAWAFYKSRNLSLLPQAEIWARKAVFIVSENLDILHTLACVLSALGKSGEALELANKYIQGSAFVEKTIGDAIELFVELAAAGYAKEALEMITDSPAAKHLEPLEVGLKLFVGEDVKTAVEIMEVAKDVVKRIEERRASRENPK